MCRSITSPHRVRRIADRHPNLLREARRASFFALTVYYLLRNPEHRYVGVFAVVRRQGEQLDYEIEKLLTGASESSDLIYFKLYKSQISVVEQALEIAARMLGADLSRGYCLEMICADFLAVAGLHVENEQDILLLGLRRIFHLLPTPLKFPNFTRSVTCLNLSILVGAPIASPHIGNEFR